MTNYLLERDTASYNSRVSRHPFCAPLLSLLTMFCLAVTGCGGGNSSGGTSPPPPPTFTLSLSSPSLTLAAGSTATVAVTVVGANGFNGVVALTAGTPPSGVTISPATANLSVGQSQAFTLTAATYIARSTSNLSFSGTSVADKASATLSLLETPWAQTFPLSRSRYVRTDAVDPFTVIFDPPTNRFFMSDPGSNHIFVLDAASQTLIGSIDVPGASGMDETPDHHTLYAGTLVGDVYAIDPVGMKVLHRYQSYQIGAKGFPTASVSVLADGRLVLAGGQGQDLRIHGYTGFAIWNPADNSAEIFCFDTTTTCPIQTAPFEVTVTGDRSLVIVSNGDVTCTMNPSTDRANCVAIAGFPATPTNDGKSVLILQYGVHAQVFVLDAQTMVQTSSFPVVGPSGSYVVVSPDSSTLYIAPQTIAPVYAYNIASGNQLGWVPDINLGGISVLASTMDNAGFLAGVTIDGIGILDTSAPRANTPEVLPLNGHLSPATGPTAGSTTVQLGFSPSQDLGAVYFGQNAAAVAITGSQLSAISPAGAPGPVDVVSITTTGSELILPLAFSYGPTILEVTPNLSTAEGGGTGVVYGFGFGLVTCACSTPIPADLQVTVGGQPAIITGFSPNAYDENMPPFQLQSLSYTIPPGTAGATADVAVSTSSGSMTSTKALQYLPPVQQIQMTGSPSLAQGIYDPKRDVYYFTDSSQVDVYSLSKAQWLSPFAFPAAPTGTTHRLWGIALSPDGDHLAVSDAGAGMIYLLNPDTPASMQAFVTNYQAIIGGSPAPGVTQNPSGIAVSDLGSVYFAAFTNAGTGYDGYFKLDTATGAITGYPMIAAGGPLDRAAIASDNSRVFFNDDGDPFSINTATDQISEAIFAPQCCYGDYELYLSSGQSTLQATGYLYDTQMNTNAYLTTNDRESLNISYVYGAKLSGDGSLLFQPSTNGIDVYDGRVGTLRARIALPVALSQNYDALVEDGKDNVLIAITGQTGSGIAVVDLSSLPVPDPLPYSSGPKDWPSGSNTDRESKPRPQDRSPLGRLLGKRLAIPHVSSNILQSRAKSARAKRDL